MRNTTLMKVDIRLSRGWPGFDSPSRRKIHFFFRKFFPGCVLSDPSKLSLVAKAAASERREG